MIAVAVSLRGFSRLSVMSFLPEAEEKAVKIIKKSKYSRSPVFMQSRSEGYWLDLVELPWTKPDLFSQQPPAIIYSARRALSPEDRVKLLTLSRAIWSTHRTSTRWQMRVRLLLQGEAILVGHFDHKSSCPIQISRSNTVKWPSSGLYW